MNDLVGRTLLGKLAVLRELGAGGAGQVFEVEHVVTRQRRALKVLRADLCQSGEAVARLVREAAAAGRIRSDAVVETLDAGRLDDGRAFLLMELAEGRTLRALLDAEGPLPERAALRVALRVCEGLAAVHEAGLVHRDVKPENVLVDGELVAGAGLKVRLLDFGVCKLTAADPAGLETLTRTGAIVGTPAYMAPEQLDAEREVDGRVDLWSLGVLLFEMTTGARPYPEKTAAGVASAIHRGAPPRARALRPEIGAPAEALIARLLERDPDRRIGSARAALEEIVRLLGPEGELAPGRVLSGRFEVVRAIGRGSSGEVYEVLERGDPPQRRALKVLSRGAGASGAERLIKESELAREVDAPHVARVFEAGWEPELERPWVSMELCEGLSVAALVARGPCDRALALDLLEQAASALDAVHARGIIHRDVKPANLFLHGDPPLLKLLDFGVAKRADADRSGATASDVILGTPLYLAPEQARSDKGVGGAADRYALGQLAYTLLVGRAYFDADARAGLLPLMGAIGRGAVERASRRAARAGVALPASFDDWFKRATALDPEARFSSAGQQIAALRSALGRGGPRWRAPLGVIALAAAGLAVWFGSNREAPAAAPEQEVAPRVTTREAETSRAQQPSAAPSAPPATGGLPPEPPVASASRGDSPSAAPSASGARGSRAPQPPGPAHPTASARKPPDSLF